MAFFGVFGLIALLLSGSASNELLDYIPTDAYWQAKGVQVEADVVLLELQNVGEGEVDAAAAVRQLMAIRALGELRAQAAVETLTALQGSQRPFVAEYAGAALAKIHGGRGDDADSDAGEEEGAATQPADAALEGDLAVLPAGLGLIVQVRVEGHGPVDLDKLIADSPMLGMAMDSDPELGEAGDAAGELAKQAIELAERIGNVRIDGITFGLSDNVSDDAGYATAVIHGLADRDAIAALIREEAMGELIEASRDGVVLFEESMEGFASILLASNERAVFVFSGGEGKNPVDDVLGTLAKIAGGESPEPVQSPQMTALIETIDRTGPIWAAVTVNPNYAQVPTLGAFDIVMLQTEETDEGKLLYSITGVGSDEPRVKAASAEMRGYIDQAVMEMTGEMQDMKEWNPEGIPMVQGFIDILKGIQIDADGTTATLRGSVEGGLGSLMTGMMMGF